MICRQEQEEKRIQVPAGRFTSSYRAEMAALDAALGTLLTAPASWELKEVRICSDSQAALRRLNEVPAAQTDVLSSRV